MSSRCCLAGRGRRLLPRRLSRATASILPAALLMLLPKCPLCLAAWLTVATGVTFSTAGAMWLRWSLVLLWIGALLLMIWRRGLPHRSAS
ncbi:MAG TPA: hypothetical protein VGF59_20680 [Bryobacteraceae bacterium]